MEYLPYKQVEGNPHIQIFPNEYHGLLMFGNIEEGKKFLLDQAKSFITYEESGKSAENCVYDSETVQTDIASVKEGYFIEELEDGYFLHQKINGGFPLYSSYFERVHVYLLAPLARKTVKPPTPRERILKEGKEEICVNQHDSLLQELKSLISSSDDINQTLKPTGIKARLVEKDTVYSSEEVEESDPTEEYTDTEEETIRQLDEIINKIRGKNEGLPELEELLLSEEQDIFIDPPEEKDTVAFDEKFLNDFQAFILPKPILSKEERKGSIVKKWSQEEYSSDADEDYLFSNEGHNEEEITHKEDLKFHLSW